MLAGINAAIHMTAFFSPICFYIDSVTGFCRGPLGYTCHVVSAVLLFRLIWLTFSEYRNLKRLDTFIPIFNAMIIIAAVVADSFKKAIIPALTAALESGEALEPAA